MTNRSEVLAAYHTVAQQTGSYLVARQWVLSRFQLNVYDLDRLLGADRHAAAHGTLPSQLVTQPCWAAGSER